MIATPVTLRPMFEADPAMKELGGPALSGAADRIGRRADRRAAVRAADLRPRDAAHADRGRARPGRQGDGHLEGGQSARRRSKRPRRSCSRSRPMAAAKRRSRPSRRPAPRRSRWPTARSIRAAACRASRPGSTSINAKMGGLHHSDLIILAGRPGMGKTSLATNIAFNAAQRYMQDDAGRDRSEAADRRQGRVLQPGNVGRSAGDARAGRTVADFEPGPAHGQDQPVGDGPAGGRRRASCRTCRS